MKGDTSAFIRELWEEIAKHQKAINEIIKNEGMKGLKERIGKWQASGGVRGSISKAGRRFTRSLGSAGPRKVWPHYPGMAIGADPTAVGSPTGKLVNEVMSGSIKSMVTALGGLADDVTEVFLELLIKM